MRSRRCRPGPPVLEATAKGPGREVKPVEVGHLLHVRASLTWTPGSTSAARLACGARPAPFRPRAPPVRASSSTSAVPRRPSRTPSTSSSVTRTKALFMSGYAEDILADASGRGERRIQKPFTQSRFLKEIRNTLGCVGFVSQPLAEDTGEARERDSAEPNRSERVLTTWPPTRANSVSRRVVRAEAVLPEGARTCLCAARCWRSSR